MSTQSELARRWLETAGRDLLAARNCIDGPHFLPGIAAYHCQQAGEKLVKAALIYRGIEPIISYDVDMLIAVDRQPSPDPGASRSIYALCRRISLSGGRMTTPALQSGKKSAAGLPRSTR